MKGKNIDIIIAKADINKFVRVRASYMGSKSMRQEGLDVYDQIEIAEADSIITDKLMDECVSTLVEFISRNVEWIGTSSPTGTTDYKISILMPLNFNEDNDERLSRLALEFIGESILRRWYETASKDNVQMTAVNEQKKLEEIYGVLCERIRPYRRESKPYTPTIEFVDNE